MATLQGKAPGGGKTMTACTHGGRRRRRLPAPRGAGAQRTVCPVRSWVLRVQCAGGSPRPRRHLGVPPSLPKWRLPSSHLPAPVGTHQSAPLVQPPVHPGRPWKPHPAGTTSGPDMPLLAVHPGTGQDPSLIG